MLPNHLDYLILIKQQIHNIDSTLMTDNYWY
jgi:hypothetical protein